MGNLYLAMADEGIFCTTAEVLRKAGANASATSTAEAYTNDFVAQAESFINNAVRYNFSDNYSTLNADTRDILKEAASNLAAIYCILYDMDAIGINEAENRITILRDRANWAIKLLQDKKSQDFLNGS